MTEPQCEDCTAHESGCCWSCKMKHMRSRSTGVVVPRAFKSEFTNRERIAEAHADAAKSGRSIQKYTG